LAERVKVYSHCLSEASYGVRGINFLIFSEPKKQETKKFKVFSLGNRQALA
jgi:hypothetical protein